MFFKKIIFTLLLPGFLGCSSAITVVESVSLNGATKESKIGELSKSGSSLEFNSISRAAGSSVLNLSVVELVEEIQLSDYFLLKNSKINSIVLSEKYKTISFRLKNCEYFTVIEQAQEGVSNEAIKTPNRVLKIVEEGVVAPCDY